MILNLLLTTARQNQPHRPCLPTVRSMLLCYGGNRSTRRNRSGSQGVFAGLHTGAEGEGSSAARFSVDRRLLRLILIPSVCHFIIPGSPLSSALVLDGFQLH
jgi:hypothetical protein